MEFRRWKWEDGRWETEVGSGEMGDGRLKWEVGSGKNEICNKTAACEIYT